MIVGKSSSILIDCNFCLIKRNIDFQLILQQSLMSLFLIQPSPPLPPYTVLLLFLRPLPLRSISITSTMTTPSTPPSPAFAAVATTPYTECLLKDCWFVVHHIFTKGPANRGGLNGGAGGVGPPPMMKWGGANLKRGVKSEKFLRRAPPPKTHSSTDPPQQSSLSPPLPANLRPPPPRLADEKV